MHIYSLQVWDWPRACNCQEGEIFPGFYFIYKRIAVEKKKKKKKRRWNRDQRTFKEIYYTIILLYFVRIESTKGDGDDLEKKYYNKVVESVAECFSQVLLRL